MDTSDLTKPPPDLAELTANHHFETFGDRSSANEGPALFECSSHSVDLQKSSVTDLCGSEQTDLEVQKSCELLRDEIKHLAQSQGSSSPWNYGTGNSILTHGIHPPKTLGEQHTQDAERGENTSSPVHLLREPDIQQRAFITQEHFLENTSVSSGYGTLSASEPNACLSSCSQNTSRDTRLTAKQTLKECRTQESMKLNNLKHVPIESESPFMLMPGAKCHLPHLEKSSEGKLPEHLEPHLDCDKSNVRKKTQPTGKSLTTWAQKQKLTSYKKVAKMDQVTTLSSLSNSHPEKDLEYTDGSSNTFYLNRTESTNSLFSAGSGFTYWMLDEKEMYHPLPEKFEAGFSKLFPTKEPEEARIPSLTDIYQQKQKDCGHFPGWELISPFEHTHPPEVLTLDPTLHKKSPHNMFLSKPATPCSESYTAPVTPDSISENAAVNRYDEESASTVSSLLGYSSNRSPHSAVPDDEWKRTRYQGRRNVNSQPCHGDSSGDERMNCTEDDVNSLTPCSIPQSPVAEENMQYSSAILSVEHPVMLSNIRRSLREKHARHLSDLREYYESEISSLKQQLVANNKSTTSEDEMKISSLTERCDQMEGALTEASKQIHILENKNNELEKQVAEWKEHYHFANNTSKDLKEQVELMRERSKEKENAISRLQSRLKEVEESLERAFRKSDDQEARIKQEHKMFQDLLLEYESLGKEHERVKDVLSITENKLCDTHGEVNELRRTVSKLEKQTKQLEHESMVKLHHLTESQLWSSNPNNEMIHTTGNLKSRTASSIFTGRTLDNRAKEMENKQETQYVSTRYHSPPEKDVLHDIMAAKPKVKDGSSQESPILKALRDFEEEKGLKNWDTLSNKDHAFYELSCKRQMADFSDFTPLGSPESKARQRRVNSPSAPRSSSLPPTIRKSATTPTKRELMLTPLSVKYSPKRSPRENLSPGLSQLLCDETTITRFDVAWDDSARFKDPSPRKRLQFMSQDDPEDIQKANFSPESNHKSPLPLLPPFETEITYNERMKNLTDTERLFDQLTEEKKQIEAALSRMPCTGRRLSLQMRATKENLEDRLEKINRDLGSIRMTLKKYHVLPTSANI
ncbi:M-phase phosphoprotein 9 isoform X2 [Mixophyes fleayi]|uniref:M-phase phosphoprotein 9 isoform X2 n=1 Tax=Mixophyes fleayi TaxID=3061075 RepID=UPI003F4DD70B